MKIDLLFESFNLSYALAILAMVGFFLAVYVNQQTHYEGEDIPDPGYVKVFRRFSYLLLAWSFLWIISFAQEHGWQPWPPVVLMIFSFDMIMVIRALAIRSRVKRSGVKSFSPRGEAESMARSRAQW